MTVPESVATDTTSASAAVVRAAEYLATDNEDDRDDEMTDQFGEPIELIDIDLSAFASDITAAFTELPEQPHVFEDDPIIIYDRPAGINSMDRLRREDML